MRRDWGSERSRHRFDYLRGRKILPQTGLRSRWCYGRGLIVVVAVVDKAGRRPNVILRAGRGSCCGGMKVEII